MNGRGMSRSLSKEQNTLIVHCTLAVLYAERRGNHFFHFHMGNISILFLHPASSRYPCSPKAEKIPFPSWWLAGVALFQLFCFLFGCHCMDLQLNAVADQSLLQSTFEDSKYNQCRPSEQTEHHQCWCFHYSWNATVIVSPKIFSKKYIKHLTHNFYWGLSIFYAIIWCTKFKQTIQKNYKHATSWRKKYLKMKIKKKRRQKIE